MRKYFLVFILILLVPVLSYLQYKQQSYFTLEGFAQGTTYRIIYQYPFGLNYIFNRQSVLLNEEIDTLLAEIDRSLSIYRPESVISRINSSETGGMADPFLEEVFSRSVAISAETDGAFDITVGPLVRAWGFGPEGKPEPGNMQTDSLLQFIGMSKVRLEGGKIIKETPGVMLDVNAIAQGYSVDLIARFLEEQGVVNYLAELGGEINTRGSKKGGEPWSIGLDKPIENNLSPNRDLQVVLKVHKVSLATSGNYRKFYEVGGVKYSHTIDPRTGFPARHRLLSATITAHDCTTADAFATACMVAGLEESIELVEGKDGLEGYFVYSGPDGEFLTYITEGFRQYLSQPQELLP